jgi:lipoprotein NlpI
LAAYPRLRIWLIRSRLGEPADATVELTGYLNSLHGAQADDWTAKIGRFLTGTLAEQDFLDAAKNPAGNSKQQDGRLCQADYYAGMKHLLAGDKDGANTLLKKSTGTGEKGYTEYVSAEVELGALKK